jgi:hypothetical protein
MKRFNQLALVIASIALPSCYGCGNTTTDSEVTAQVKKVVKRTPIFCPNYTEVDVSLGVMRNGVGSMTHEDMVLRVMNESYVPELDKAAKDGSIITMRYDEARVSLCYPDFKMNSFKIDIDPADTQAATKNTTPNTQSNQ